MSGLGRQLQEARERMRVTVTAAAAATHLKMVVIDAMERDDYPKLIAPAYAKGFYRLYCEYLGLNAEPFISAYLFSSGASDDKADLIRDPKKKPGLFSGLQKKMQALQERKEIQRKAKEIADAQRKARELAREQGPAPAADAGEEAGPDPAAARASRPFEASSISSSGMPSAPRMSLSARRSSSSSSATSTLRGIAASLPKGQRDPHDRPLPRPRGDGEGSGRAVAVGEALL